jgi:hypothetical protein
VHILQQLQAPRQEMWQTYGWDITVGALAEFSYRDLHVNLLSIFFPYQAVYLKNNSHQEQLLPSYTTFKLLVSVMKMK